MYKHSRSTDKGTRVLTLASILITVLLIDMILSSFFDVFGQVLISRWGLIFFIVNTIIIFGVGQYLLLTYVKRATEGLRTKKGVKATYSLVVVVQYIVIGMLGLIILQMLFNSHYSTLLIIAVTIMSYVPACIILFLLSYRFYMGYRLSKNAITFLFLIGSFFVGVNLAAGVVIHSYYLGTKKPETIAPHLYMNFQS